MYEKGNKVQYNGHRVAFHMGPEDLFWNQA